MLYADVSMIDKEMAVVLIHKIDKYYEYLAQHLNKHLGSSWETSFTLEDVWSPYLHPDKKLIYEQRMSNAKTDHSVAAIAEYGLLGL